MNPRHWIDEKSGFCPATKTFHSLRFPTPFPPDHRPLSLADYAFSLLRSAPHSPLETTTVLIDASSHHRLTYSQFIRQVRSLAASLRRRRRLTKGDTAFILCPPSLKIPVLYFALLSIGVTVSPANPLSSDSEISHQIHLCRPAIAFTSSRTARKLPATLRLGTVLVDSEEFDSMVSSEINVPAGSGCDCERVEVSQYDTAAILYSSGTTGLVKGVLLTHRNLISLIATLCHGEAAGEEEPRPVSLFTLPLFHVFGFFMLVRAVAMAETLVLMERFDFERMLKAVEKYRITYMPVSPPLVVALAKSELVGKYDLSSLQLLGSGGAPLSKEVSETFASRFPNVLMVQGYGLTESGGGVVGMADPDEAKRHGSAGRLMANMEAKIVHPQTGELLLPGQKGELWLRGPTIMKGYVGNDEATAATLDPEGWLKTGDLCYFDSDGFLFIVDRLKELIKYKAYQVPPAELEYLLLSSPEIVDAAVIPYPDEEAGEIPMAFVVRKPGSSITDAQVMEFIAKQVAPYKKVRRVAFINSIPKSLAGKILRRELLNHSLSKPRL